MNWCQIEGCPNTRRSTRPWCESHRWRLRVHGDLFAHVPIGSLRIRKSVEQEETAAEREQRIAHEPTPAEGHGFLWLV